MQQKYFVYIMTNKNNSVLYTGVTNNLIKRVWEHKNKVLKGFTAKYNCNKLVWYEAYDDIYNAIKREKQIKGGSRKNKIELINSLKPMWIDLYDKLMNS